MRRIAYWAALASAAVAVPAAANAQLYTSVEGGAVKAQKMKYDLGNLDDFMQDKSKVGYSIGSALGYDFGGFRVEGEFSYQETKLKELGFDLHLGSAFSGLFGPSRNVSGKTRVAAGMLNGYYDFHLGRVIPFVGVGIGAGRVELRNYVYEGIFVDSDADWGLAYQAMAGVRVPVTDRLGLSLKYRYFNVRNVKYDFAGSPLKGTYHSHSVLAGLSYSFGSNHKDEESQMAPPPPIAPAPAAEPVAPPPAPVQTAFVVFFNWNRTNLTAEAMSILDNAAAAYSSTGKASVMLAGHADTSGPAPYNEKLSQRRADTVKAYLIGKGIPKAVIETQAFGETNLPVQTPDQVREPLNRRVDITFGPGSGQ